MEEIKKAKLKALIYLKKRIDEKWHSHDKLESQKFFSGCDDLDWPLRFEAYSYLSNKYKKNINNFAIELRDLWNHWIELNKKGRFGSHGSFWPSVYEFVGSIDPDGNAERFPGNEIENHISMFRVKEILGIGGFEAYFNAAKERLKNMLLEKHPHSWYDDFRITWQISRSPTLRLQLSDYLNVVYLRLKEEKEFNQLLSFDAKDDFGLSQYQAMCMFFLCFSGLEGISDKFVKVATSNLIDKQEKDGSFGCDVLSTCLCASSIYYTKADPSNSVCNKAIKYILSKQNKKGYWHFLLGESNTWDIFSTVVVLETLDLITNDKPMPIWAEKSRLSSIIKKKKPPRIQPIRPFSTPPGITWYDVSICFTSREVVQLRAGDTRETRNFAEMGFENQRTHTPDWSWEAMIEFGKNQGEISIDIKQQDIHPKIQRNIKYHVWTMKQRLRELFNIDENPFFPYDRKTKTYKLKCAVSGMEDFY